MGEMEVVGVEEGQKGEVGGIDGGGTERNNKPNLSQMVTMSQLINIVPTPLTLAIASESRSWHLNCARITLGPSGCRSMVSA